MVARATSESPSITLSTAAGKGPGKASYAESGGIINDRRNQQVNSKTRPLAWRAARAAQRARNNIRLVPHTARIDYTYKRKKHQSHHFYQPMREDISINLNREKANKRENLCLSAVAMGFTAGKLDSEIDAAAFIFPITVACRLRSFSATDFRRRGVSVGSGGCNAVSALIGDFPSACLRCLGGLVRGDRLDLAFE